MQSETGRPAGQPAMILKFTGRVEKILTGSISGTVYTKQQVIGSGVAMRESGITGSPFTTFT